MTTRTFLVDGGELRVVTAQYDDPPAVVNDQVGQIWVKPAPDQPYQLANEALLSAQAPTSMGEATFVARDSP